MQRLLIDSPNVELTNRLKSHFDESTIKNNSSSQAVNCTVENIERIMKTKHDFASPLVYYDITGGDSIFKEDNLDET